MDTPTLERILDNLTVEVLADNQSVEELANNLSIEQGVNNLRINNIMYSGKATIIRKAIMATDGENQEITIVDLLRILDSEFSRLIAELNSLNTLTFNVISNLVLFNHPSDVEPPKSDIM